MQPHFHLSIGVHSIEEELTFFCTLLGAKVLHRDPSGYVNIDLYHSQITLKPNSSVDPKLPDFHFGVNLSLDAFDALAEHVLKNGRQYVVMAPEVWDFGAPLERKKMYLKCPTGYSIELKGYR